MAERESKAERAAEREKFRAFLRQDAHQSLADWELRMLGGFGGYQSQTRPQLPQNQAPPRK